MVQFCGVASRKYGMAFGEEFPSLAFFLIVLLLFWNKAPLCLVTWSSANLSADTHRPTPDSLLILLQLIFCLSNPHTLYIYCKEHTLRPASFWEFCGGTECRFDMSRPQIWFPLLFLSLSLFLSLDPCTMSPVVGPCKGVFPRWYYDPSTGECKHFLYSGCKGNHNNFLQQADCANECIQKPGEQIC